MVLVVGRTGPRRFNTRVMARFKEVGMEGHAHGGVPLPKGANVEIPDENALFKLVV